MGRSNLQSLLLATLLIPRGTLAHETWIVLSRTPSGGLVAQIGTGNRFPVSDSAVKPDRIARALVRIGGTTVGSLENPRPEGKATLLDVAYRGRGVASVAVELRPKAIRIPPREFEAYLTEIGADDALGERRRRNETRLPGREVYQKLPKTFLDMGPSAVLTPPIGLPMELVVEQHPFQLRAGSSLVLTVLREGKLLPNQFVRAFGEDGKVYFSGRTDGNGQLDVPLPKPGRVLLAATAIRRLAEGTRQAGSPYAEADWESHWASLTLAVLPK